MNNAHFTYGVLSNGSFIDDEMIRILARTKVSFVQLSIDGKKETHDFLRAPGDYERVFRTASYLERSGIRTYISFTANKTNYKDLPGVASECRKRGITKLWSDRLVPIGNGLEIQHLAITEEDLPAYLHALKKARGGFLKQKCYPKTTVAMDRALQFENSKERIYSCSAGDRLITVDEFGNIMPCRRMPILCGTVFETTLSEVYFHNEVFKALRVKTTPKECSICKYAYFCKGGARCQSFAAYGSYHKADPACPQKRSKQGEIIRKSVTVAVRRWKTTPISARPAGRQTFLWKHRCPN